MKELYAPFTRTGAPIMMMDTASAELCKYAANSILATRISFMNEIANVCELVGADVDQVRKAIGVGSADRHLVPVSRRRLRRQLLSEGRARRCCKSSRGQGLRLQDPATRSKRSTTRRSCGWSSKMEAHFGDLRGRTIALWGLAFKPRTDDMREAPAIAIIERLLERGATVRAYDPEAAETARRLFGDRIALCEKSYDALDGADALAIVTEWNEFREPDFSEDASADASRRSCSTAATSTRPSTCARSASPTSPLAAEPRARPGDRRRRLHRQPRLQGARAAPATRRSSTTTWSPAIARRVSYGELVEGDITDVGAVRGGAPPARDLGGDALRGVSRRRRIGARAGALLPQQRRRRAERARGDGGRVGHGTSSSRRPARPTASRSRRRSPRRIRSSRSTATARRSWRSSGRCRTSSARTACAGSALRYFNAAGADPDGEIGEDHSPEIHLIPRAIEAAHRRAAACRCSATTTRRRTAPACATTSTSPTWPTRTSRRSRRSSRRGESGAYNLGHRPAAFGARGHRRGRAGDRARGAVDARRRAGPAIRPCCTPRRRRRRPSCTGRRASPISTPSSGRRGTGTGRIRTGIGRRPRIRERDPLRSAACSATRRRIAAGSRGRSSAMLLYAVGIGRPRLRSSSRSSTDVLPNQERLGA